MKKPVIKFNTKLQLWVCKGCNIKEYGDTPSQSYIRWRILKDQTKYHAKQLEDKIRRFNRTETPETIHW